MATKKTTAKAATTVKSTRQSGKKAYGPHTVIEAASRFGFDVSQRLDEYELKRPKVDPETEALVWESFGTRWAATVTTALPPSLGLDILRRNDFNREIKFHDTRKHASTMRGLDVATNAPTQWEPRTENLAVGIDVPTCEPRLLDGQNRVLAAIVAHGTREEVAKAFHVLNTHRYNREYGTSLDPFFVYKEAETNYPEDGPDSMPFEEYYPEAVKQGWLQIPKELSDWKFRNDPLFANMEWPPLPVFDIAFGADPLVRLRADSDQTDRTASDFLIMDPEVGNELLRHGIDENATALLLNSIRLACTPSTKKEKKIDKDGNETTVETEGLGSLRKGGKGLKSGVVHWFRTFRDAIHEEHRIWQITLNVASSIGGKASERAVDCQKPVSITNGVVQGNQIPDNQIRQMVILALLGKQDPEKVAEWAVEARYGVKATSKGYVISNRFDAIRQHRRDLKLVSSTPNVDVTLRSMVAACKTSKAKLVTDHNDLRGRFPGPDTDMLDEATLKRTKGIDPNAKQGRPKGSKAKK